MLSPRSFEEWCWSTRLSTRSWFCALFVAVPWVLALHFRIQLAAHRAAMATLGVETYRESHGGTLRYIRSPTTKWGIGLSRLKDLEHNRSAWGKRCHRPDYIGVLVALPYKVSTPDQLANSLYRNIMSLECSNEGFNLYLGISSEAPSMLNDIGGRNRISMIRNIIIRRFLRPEHEFVFWLDADITNLPPDTIRRLHTANPGGVTAPAVVLEKSNTSDYHMSYCHKPACSPGGGFRFYDTAAFFEAGKTVQLANKRERGHAQFGSVTIWPPYAGTDSTKAVEMESVGTVYLTPAEVYRCESCPPDVHFEHFSTSFTEHFPIVHAARHYFGFRVVFVRDVIVEHAALTRYGELWHDPGNKHQWLEWLQVYLGKRLDDPDLRVDRLHPHRMIPAARQSFEDLTEEELRRILRSLRLPTEGEKAALIRRVLGVLREGTPIEVINSIAKLRKPPTRF